MLHAFCLTVPGLRTTGASSKERGILIHFQSGPGLREELPPPWLLLAILCWSRVSVSLELIWARRNLIVSVQWPSECTVPRCRVIHSCWLLIARSETQQHCWDTGCLSPWQKRECPNLNLLFSSVAWYFRGVLHNFNVSVQPGKEIGWGVKLQRSNDERHWFASCLWKSHWYPAAKTTSSLTNGSHLGDEIFHSD